MQEFFLQLSKALGIQITALFGIFFVFGYILSKLQEWTHNNYHKSVGWKGILWTAWFGTPLHEYSHVFFAKVFHHRIDEIALFRPNKDTGELGYVNQSFNKYSFYQSFGNLFVGSAPMIFGSVLLFTLLYFIVPNGREIISLLRNTDSITNIVNNIWQSILLLFSVENLKTIWFWLFLYISFCISSHIAPSKADRRGMWYGFWLIIIVLIVFNIIFSLLKIDITKYILNFSHLLKIFIAIFIYATIISFTHLLFSYIILWPFKKR